MAAVNRNFLKTGVASSPTESGNPVRLRHLSRTIQPTNLGTKTKKVVF